MTEVEHTSDSEMDDPKKITDAESCLDYLKRREVFLYKMMNDPSHKAMLYFLEVLMNSDSPVTVEQLAARFAHKSFSQEMREACGGGSAEGLREFLLRYPSLFNVRANGQVTSVAIELPGLEGLSEELPDVDLGCYGLSTRCPSLSNNSTQSTNHALNSELFKVNAGKIVQRRSTVSNKTTDGGEKYKQKSSSSLSLTSIPSNASSSSESGTSFNRPNANDQTNSCNHNSVKSNPTNLHRRGSNPSMSSWSRPGIYQPPPLREQNRLICDICPSQTQFCEHTNGPVCATVSSTACVHCPLYDLACHHHHQHHHHHCTLAHHHHMTASHCLCPTSGSHCHACHSAVSQSSTTIRSGTSWTPTYCALPPIDKLILETEAVRFFQQKLLKREERWVPIKSLAGHLSQATPEVRSVVGPQLEFRNFLLKHSHVFEVQGELVSVKDPFGNIFPQRRPRERFSSMHTSFSTTNLSLNTVSANGVNSGLIRNIGSERVPRPKSLILSGTHPLLPSPFVTSATFGNRRNPDSQKRSTHFADNFVTACYPASGATSHSESASSAPNTPTGHQMTLANQRHSNSKTAPKVDSTFFSQSSVGTAISSSTDLDSCNRMNTNTSTMPTTNSISISMSANEYRAIMFLRKVLEKRGGAPEQTGLAINELMHILSDKAPETVQSTIGWTKVELEEFLSQHRIFFDLCPTQSAQEMTPTRGPTEIGRLVKNKKLEKMINIVITGTKPAEANARTLTNRCGRIFHVAKLWGIIDLGRHEHVFFDKSIFKHVDDLQKYFKMDELLYFNAILAPKESRAKWRATQVWKECDRENVEKFGMPRSSSDLSSGKFNFDDRSPNGYTKSFVRDTPGKLEDTSSALVTNRSTDYTGQHTNEDTEAEEEIEDIEVDNSGSVEFTRPHKASQQTNEFLMNVEEEADEEELLLSAIAREEGLNLAKDVRFLTDDISQDSRTDKVVSSTQHNSHSNAELIKTSFVTSNGACNPAVCCTNKQVHLDRGLNGKSNNHVSSSTEQTPSECTSSEHSKPSGLGTNYKDDNVNSLSSTGSSAISIAVQTVSTGEIMATQLYHDPNKQSCTSG
ncbi:exonuclease 3'-5' domain-containing protein 1 [Paragonimus westermani]|uniref:Exonuclease 3'-5' domain-containing protein 1 n=1 Tax=Paragonimus westermani TaxID=34504 RepID=A0A5J4NYT0_9TREM|nr:exonuclease 3'-5' domain-containing protein 1 [Paragonimus westermani]